MRGAMPYIRLGHAVQPHHHHKRGPDPTCATGGFYKNPTNGATVNSSQPVNITWDTTCLNASKVDIYLIAPTMQAARIHVWQNVDNSAGAFQATLKPKWWNATATQSLQLTIIDTGLPPFLSTLPAGPVFTATYTAPADGSIPPDANPNIPDSSFTDVNGATINHSHMSKGKVAAAVLLPLLLVIAGIAIYIRTLRSKGIEKRKRWSEAIDKRMSTISTDWRSMSGAGANAAIRSSFASNHPYAADNLNSRLSTFDYSRPTSMAEFGQAGVGARGLYQQDNLTSQDVPQMSQLRKGVTAASIAADRASRVSKVSFADDPRVSMDSRRVTSRAFHTGFVPPLPQRQTTIDVDSTQREGPLDLTPDAIRQRLSGHSDGMNEVDEVMPALTMMRTGGESANEGNNNNEDYLLWESTSTPTTPSEPQPPPAALSKPENNNDNNHIVGMMPGMIIPPNVLSPDEMLRAYAERGNGAGSPAFPGPVMYNGNGARTLYSPGRPLSPAGASPSSAKSPKTLPSLLRMGTKKSKRMSDKWSEEDAYGGTAGY